MKYSNYRIQDDQIIFDYYEFYFSSLRQNKVVTLDRIKEVDFNSYPCSMEIDNGEIIFFNHNDNLEVKKFSEKHKIPESKRTDIWNLICNEFLDTEFEEAEIKRNQKTLLELAFSVSEIQKIRKKIKWILFGTTEWKYLGHWDLLAMKQSRSLFYRLNGHDFYWWTMNTALRGKTNANKTSDEKP